jgi:hypothetical protein
MVINMAILMIELEDIEGGQVKITVHPYTQERQVGKEMEPTSAECMVSEMLEAVGIGDDDLYLVDEDEGTTH